MKQLHSILLCVLLSSIWTLCQAKKPSGDSSTVPTGQGELVAFYPFTGLVVANGETTTLDDSGNDYTATVLSSHPADYTGEDLKADQSTVCTGIDFPMNVDSGSSGNTDVQDAILSSVDIDQDVGNVGMISFWYYPQAPWNSLDPKDRRMLFDATYYTKAVRGDAHEKSFFMELDQHAKLTFYVEDSADTDFSVTWQDQSFVPNNGWVYISAAWDMINGVLQIYIDGELKASSSFVSSTQTLGNLNTLAIGDNRNLGLAPIKGGHNSANGILDEIRIYDGIKPTSQLQTDMSYQTDNCPISSSQLAYFTISHDGSALTCAAEQIVITAYDQDGQLYQPAQGTELTISIQDVNTTQQYGDIISVDHGSISKLSDNQYRYQYNGTVNAFTLTYRNIAAATVNFDLQTIDERSEQTVPDGTSVQDANLVFNTIGFRFVDAVGNAMPENQLAYKASSTFYIQALQAQDDNPAQCEGVFADQQQVEVQFRLNCPTSECISTQALQLNNTDIQTTGYNGILLTFDQDAKAPLTLQYPDVARLQLSARYQDTQGWSVQGDSTSFVVSPAAICIDMPATANCTTLDKSCSAFVKAGASFDIPLQAVGYQTGAACDAPRNSLANFNLMDYRLQYQLRAPSHDGVDQSIHTLQASHNNFNAGLATLQTQYDNVGIIQLDSVAAQSYLGVELPIIDTTLIGRFYPAYFSIDLFELLPNCSSYSYMGIQNYKAGEAFSYGALIQARTTQGQTATNYHDDFANLTWSQLSFSTTGAATTGSLVQIQSDTQVDFNTGQWNLPVNQYQLAYVVPAASAPYAPETSAIQLTVANPDGTAQDSRSAESANALEFRMGRLQLSPGFASETTDLSIPYSLQYFNGEYWTVNTADNCTVIAANQGFFDSTSYQNDLQAGDTQFSGGGNAAQQGKPDSNAPLLLTAPLQQHIGSVDVGIDVTAMPWLDRTDVSCRSSPAPADCTATMTFGRYKGSERVIFWQEIGQ